MAQALIHFRQLPEPNRRYGGGGVAHVLSPQRGDPLACHWESLRKPTLPGPPLELLGQWVIHGAKNLHS